MEKIIQDIKNYTTDRKNRTIVIAVSVGIAVTAGIVAFLTKKTK